LARCECLFLSLKRAWSVLPSEATKTKGSLHLLRGDRFRRFSNNTLDGATETIVFVLKMIMRSYPAGRSRGRSYFPRFKYDVLARSLNLCIGIPRARQKRRSRIARRSCATSCEPPSGARWRRAARFGCPPLTQGPRRSWPPNSSCRSVSSRPCPSWTPPSARRASCRVATSTATPRQGLVDPHWRGGRPLIA
jgi:hypothetical protein